MTDELKITIVQTNIHWENKNENTEMFSRIIRNMAQNTDLVILPEMFSTGFSMQPALLAEYINGPTVSWMSKIAREYNAVITGSIIIREKNKFLNRLIWMPPDGNLKYCDKRHLFRMGEETQYYSRGNKKLITSWKGWRFRPLVCYDLRFPVWSRNRNDYDMLIYVANWPEARRKVWKNLLVARALENQVYVVGVNRIGVDGRDISYAGESMIVNPRGNIVSEISAHKESVETISVSLDDLITFREKFPVHLDADNFRIKPETRNP
ncbi:MAG: amidohydrolase [Bacteroidetes bacterium]|nr:amidohydrolase [Bacteroidota bacterium]